jgi:hypothetical protein
MKNGVYVALIYLATIPAFAQSAAGRSCSANNAGAVLTQGYAVRVNGLLRDVHTTLQEISDRLAAGRLTPQQAQTLKLAATRYMIERLETVSAVYDAELDLNRKDKHDTGSVACDPSAQNTTAATWPEVERTVTVDELRREISK